MDENIEEQEIKNEVMKDRRTVDSLLESLVFLSTYYQRTASRESLLSGLPIHNKSMGIKDFILSSKRIGLVSKVVTRELNGISKTCIACSINA